VGDSKGLGRNFWLFAVGRFISQVGWAVQDVALPLYVLDQTHSGGMMTVFILAEAVPALIVMPFAGVIGDRYNRKWLMAGFDLLRGALLFGVIAFDFISVYKLLLVQVIMAVMGAFFSAGTGAMFPDLVDKELLEKANSTVSSLTIIARLVGPALGGLIYGIGGIMLALAINAVSFFGSGLFETLIRYEWKTRELESMDQVMADIKEGVHFIFNHTFIRTLMLFALFIGALGVPFWAVLMPYAFRVLLKFSSYQFGLLESFFMGGALLGNVIIAVKLGRKAGSYLFKAMAIDEVMIMAFIWVISPWASLAKNTAFLTLGAVAILWGVSEAFIDIPIQAKLQRAVPSEVRGRVFSALNLLANAAMPLGLIVVGPLLDEFPAWIVALGIGGAMAVVVIYYWLFYRDVLLGEGEISQTKSPEIT